MGDGFPSVVNGIFGRRLIIVEWQQSSGCPKESTDAFYPIPKMPWTNWDSNLTILGLQNIYERTVDLIYYLNNRLSLLI